MMPGSLSIETDICTSPLDAATTASDIAAITQKGSNLEHVQLVSPLQRAIESAASSMGDDDMSSTDTAISSPIFDRCSAKSSSDGSTTEEEKEEKEITSTTTTDDILTKAEAEAVEAVIPVRSLTTKKSFWNLIRGASISGAAPAAPASVVPDATPSEETKPEEKAEAATFQRQSTESLIPALNKRRSFATFPSLNWSKSSRRHTMTATNGIECEISGAIERSLDGSIHLPKGNVDEDKVAQDAIRFADARHVHKTEQNIEVIRQLANRLEQGWREKQHELTLMRLRLEESTLHLHDIRDENKQLRSQLASMSEQIVAKDDDFEQLQKVAVEQNKKERVIWQIEKDQAVQEVEDKVKELQEELLKKRRSQYHSVVDESEDDEESSDYRDAILFSATTSAMTSVDDEMQYQQATLAEPFTTPATPTSHGPNAWHAHFPTLRTDSLARRLTALQAQQVAIKVV